MADDPIDKLAVGVAQDHQAAKRKGRAKADAADTVAAGAIEGAGAALDAGGDARDVAAATIGGAAAATAEVTGDGAGAALPPIEGEGADELRDAVGRLGEAIDQRDDDAERRLDNVIDRLMKVAEEARFETGTLKGDIRDALIDILKTNPRPLNDWSEDQQRRIARAMEEVATTILRKVVVIVAEDDAGGDTIHAKLESFSEKGGLKIALTATSSLDTVIALHKAAGQKVVVKRADPERFSGQRRDVPISPDQGGLGFESDRDGADNPFGEGDQQAEEPAADGKPDAENADDDLVAAADGLDASKDGGQ